MRSGFSKSGPGELLGVKAFVEGLSCIDEDNSYKFGIKHVFLSVFFNPFCVSHHAFSVGSQKGKQLF